MGSPTVPGPLRDRRVWRLPATEDRQAHFQNAFDVPNEPVGDEPDNTLFPGRTEQQLAGHTGPLEAVRPADQHVAPLGRKRGGQQGQVIRRPTVAGERGANEGAHRPPIVNQGPDLKVQGATSAHRINHVSRGNAYEPFEQVLVGTADVAIDGQ